MRTTKVISFTAPPKLEKQIKKACKDANMTKSELLREAVRRFLDEREWRELQKYGVSQAKKLGITESQVEDLVDGVRK